MHLIFSLAVNGWNKFNIETLNKLSTVATTGAHIEQIWSDRFIRFKELGQRKSKRLPAGE